MSHNLGLLLIDAAIVQNAVASASAVSSTLFTAKFKSIVILRNKILILTCVVLLSNIPVGRSSSLVRTLALRAKGRRSESGSAHHLLTIKNKLEFYSNLKTSANFFLFKSSSILTHSAGISSFSSSVNFLIVKSLLTWKGRLHD